MISEEVKEQLDFAEKSTLFYLFANNSEDGLIKVTDDVKSFLEKTKSKKISLVNYHECFSSYKHLLEIQSIIDLHRDKKVYISSATSTQFDNFYNPLVNIFFWKYAKIRKTISWDRGDGGISLFEKSLYTEDKKKLNKGILSVRRQTKNRDYLFSLINENDFDGILRYVKWFAHEKDEVNKNLEEINKFPTFLHLIDEYKQSYISFIVETEFTKFMNPLTEKTLVAFLTKTIPIVLGGKNYVKELKNMGFYVFNNEFGFTETDDILETFDNKKIDSFYRCIQQYNKMSKIDVRNFYKDNVEKIQHNYNLISKILFDTHTQKNNII